MHAGLLRPDSAPAPALAEAAQVAAEIETMPQVNAGKSQAALVFDYESCWAWMAQPQGADFDGFRLAVAAYRALRRAGLSIDILPPDTRDLSGYQVVLAPGLMTLSAPLRAAFDNYQGTALVGPRTNTKTDELSIPVPLGPNLPNLDTVIALAESIPPFDAITLEGGGQFLHWFEHLEGTATVVRKTTSGQAAIVQAGTLQYLAGWPDDDTYYTLVAQACAAQGITAMDLPDGLRIRDTDTHRFVFNYAPETMNWNGSKIEPAGVHWEALK
jgi:beta-galactosidase